jgi:gluconate 2-dehydrogenase
MGAKILVTARSFPLLQLDNFITTPHIGSATLQTTLRIGMMASQNALAVLRGERPAPENIVNPAVDG